MQAMIVISAVLLLAACAGNPALPPGTQCSDPRPQVCTMEYNPVCAALLVGGQKQYSSGCNACADDAVASYIPDVCPSDED